MRGWLDPTGGRLGASDPATAFGVFLLRVLDQLDGNSFKMDRKKKSGHEYRTEKKQRMMAESRKGSRDISDYFAKKDQIKGKLLKIEQ